MWAEDVTQVLEHMAIMWKTLGPLPDTTWPQAPLSVALVSHEHLKD